mgnify:CR=1 FL=1
MKNLILSLAALFSVSVATAQINTTQPQQTQPDPVKGVEPDSKTKADPAVAVPIDPQTTKDQTGVIDDTQPRKDELKTRDHVKSTPDSDIVKDKDKPRKTKTRKRTTN